MKSLLLIICFSFNWSFYLSASGVDSLSQIIPATPVADSTQPVQDNDSISSEMQFVEKRDTSTLELSLSPEVRELLERSLQVSEEPNQDSGWFSMTIKIILTLLAVATAVLTFLTAYSSAKSKPGSKTYLQITMVLVLLGIIAVALLAGALLIPLSVILIALGIWAYVIVLADQKYDFLAGFFPGLFIAPLEKLIPTSSHPEIDKLFKELNRLLEKWLIERPDKELVISLKRYKDIKFKLDPGLGEEPRWINQGNYIRWEKIKVSIKNLHGPKITYYETVHQFHKDVILIKDGRSFSYLPLRANDLSQTIKSYLKTWDER